MDAELKAENRFVAKFKQLQERYENLVDLYLNGVNKACEACLRCHTWFVNEGERQSEAYGNERKSQSGLLKFTLVGLMFVFLCVLMSCQTPLASRPRARSPGPVGLQSRTPEQLYLKRDTLKIVPKSSGSSTGSLWADANASPNGRARELLSDEKPARVGEILTVAIPPELQFRWDTPGSQAGTKAAGAAGAKAGAVAKPGAGGDANSLADSELGLTDPNGVGPQAKMNPGTLASMKMEIVAIEPGGGMYLRGLRTFQNSMGERKQVMVMAHIPKRAVNGYDVNAQDIDSIQVTEDKNGTSEDYSSTGWDTVVSRKLSGFTPDLDAELSALEDVRQELSVAQRSLLERSRALGVERERLKKERDRLYAQGQGAGDEQGKDQGAGAASQGNKGAAGAGAGNGAGGGPEGATARAGAQGNGAADSSSSGARNAAAGADGRAPVQGAK